MYCIVLAGRMKNKVYTKEIDNQIISHENQMLALYNKKIKKYMPLFEKNGYYLKTGLMWKCFPKDTVILQRGRFHNGYECYVYCVVQKDGNEVRVDAIDGEADYYPLSTAWMVSSIVRKFFKLKVELYANTDDADADLSDFASQLKYKEELML